MAFPTTAYQNIPSSGIIPDDMVPASQFSFAFTFIYERDLDMSQGLESSVEAKVIVEIHDSSGALKGTFEGNEFYAIDMFPLAPGLVSYIWRWRSDKESFFGTDAEGNPIATEEQFSVGALPASGTGETDKTAILMGAFYGLAFEFDLEAGDKVSLKKHTVKAGSVDPRAALQIATRLSDTIFDTVRDPALGQSWYMFVEGKKLYCSTSVKPEKVTTKDSNGAPRGSVISDTVPRYAKLDRVGSGLYCTSQKDNQLSLRRSGDEGQTWEALMAQDIGIKLLASLINNDGSLLYVYGVAEASDTASGLASGQPAWALLQNGDEWTLGERGPCTVNGEDLPVKGPLKLEQSGSTFRLTGKDGAQVLVWTSSDVMKSWESPVEEDPTGEAPDGEAPKKQAPAEES